MEGVELGKARKVKFISFSGVYESHEAWRAATQLPLAITRGRYNVNFNVGFDSRSLAAFSRRVNFIVLKEELAVMA
jgi:hypothetical protein